MGRSLGTLKVFDNWTGGSSSGVSLVTGSWHWTLVQGTQLQEGPKR